MARERTTKRTRLVGVARRTGPVVLTAKGRLYAEVWARERVRG